MEPLNLLAIVLVTAGTLFVVVMVWLFTDWTGRRRILGAFAAEQGLEFYAKDQFDLPARFERFDLISRGLLRKASNVLHGSYQAHTLFAFDYHYHLPGEAEETSAVVFACDCRLPDLIIRTGDILNEYPDAEIVRFESHEFNSCFRVQTGDKRFAYDVINPRMMEFLLGHLDWRFEIRGAEVMIYPPLPKRWGPEQFRTAFGLVMEFLGLIPDFVWKEFGSERTREATRSSPAAAGS